MLLKLVYTHHDHHYVERRGGVHGWCVEASLILGWMLRQQGRPAEMRSCFSRGRPALWREPALPRTAQRPHRPAGLLGTEA